MWTPRGGGWGGRETMSRIFTVIPPCDLGPEFEFGAAEMEFAARKMEFGSAEMEFGT
jgi:hypothetical protein